MEFWVCQGTWICIRDSTHVWNSPGAPPQSCSNLGVGLKRDHEQKQPQWDSNCSLQGGAPKIAFSWFIINSKNYGLWLIYLELMGSIDQFITGGGGTTLCVLHETYITLRSCKMFLLLRYSNVVMFCKQQYSKMILVNTYRTSSQHRKPFAILG